MKEIRSNVSSFFLMAGRFQEVKRHAGHAIEEGRDGQPFFSFLFFHWHDGWHHILLTFDYKVNYDANLVMQKEKNEKERFPPPVIFFCAKVSWVWKRSDLRTVEEDDMWLTAHADKLTARRVNAMGCKFRMSGESKVMIAANPLIKAAIITLGKRLWKRKSFVIVKET